MIKSNFNRLSSADYVSQVERILSAMSGNANFPEPWNPPVPSLAQIQTDFAAYQSALTATQAGDKTRKVERESARTRLSNDLNLLAFYVQTQAQGDDSKLATTGYPLKQPSNRTRMRELPGAPENFEVIRGTVSGMIVIRASPVLEAGSYTVQIATADPTLESNWSEVGSYKNCGRIELQGLTPGKIYSVRMRALGVAGQGAWTVPASLMVV